MFRVRCLPPQRGVQDLIIRTAHLSLLHTYSAGWKTSFEAAVSALSAGGTRRLCSPNLSRLLLGQTSSSNLGWLYIDGRKNVITKMLSRGSSKEITDLLYPCKLSFHINIYICSATRAVIYEIGVSLLVW